jgi:hypothetical protein
MKFLSRRKHMKNLGPLTGIEPADENAVKKFVSFYNLTGPKFFMYFRRLKNFNNIFCFDFFLAHLSYLLSRQLSACSSIVVSSFEVIIR